MRTPNYRPRRPAVQLMALALAGFMSAWTHLGNAEELINDGWTEGQVAAFVGGFSTGDIAAARFEPSAACPCVVERVTLLFGGIEGSKTMRLRIWEDSTGDLAPGEERFNGEVELDGDSFALQEIDLSASPVTVDGPFRVGLEFLSPNFPTVSRDDDNTVQSDANYIFFESAWAAAADFGINGDWIIRATLKTDEIFKNGFE